MSYYDPLTEKATVPRFTAVLGPKSDTVQRVNAALYRGSTILLTMPYVGPGKVIVVIVTDPTYDATYQADRLRSFAGLGVWGPFDSEREALEAMW